MKFCKHNQRLLRTPAVALLAATLLWTPAAAQEPAPTPSPAPALPPVELTADQQREMELLLFVLNDAKTERSKRRDAAAALLARAWPAADVQLARILAQTQELQLQRAIVQALSIVQTPPDSFIDPMLALLGVNDAELREDLTAALARFENSGVALALSQRAKNPQQTDTMRLGAIHALAEHRQAAVIDTLIGLTGNDQAEAIRNAAFDALARLTGIGELGRDARQWQQWWAQHRSLPRDRWLAQLVQTLSNENRRLAQGQDKLKRRLADVYNQLYLATAAEQRPALLIQMLDDSQVEVQLLSLKLIERQVLNAQPVPDAVRESMRQHLSDPSSRVRVGVANLLRDLDDGPSVPLVLARLAEETNPTVLGAYLSLLARQPRAEAIEPAMNLLADPSTSAAAARALGVMVSRSLADESQIERIRQAAREHVQLEHVEPEIVRLLGIVAQATDEPRFNQLLKSDNPALRSAAAEAYLTELFPLEEILAYLADPVLAEKAIDAAARRAKGLGQAELLLKHSPADENLQKQWRLALVAIASRLTGQELLQLDQMLGKNSDGLPLRMAVLSTALKLGDGVPHKVNALLTLTELQMQTKAYDSATATLGALDALALTEQQTIDRERLRLDLLIARGEFEAVVNQAKAMLESKQSPAGPLVSRLMDAAELALEQKQTQQAAVLLGQVPQLSSQPLEPAQQTRLDMLRQKLASLQTTPTPAPPPPAPATP